MVLRVLSHGSIALGCIDIAVMINWISRLRLVAVAVLVARVTNFRNVLMVASRLSGFSRSAFVRGPSFGSRQFFSILNRWISILLHCGT